jgi:hypothetical protein
MRHTALPELRGLNNTVQMACAAQFAEDRRQAQRPHFPMLSGGSLFQDLDASEGWLSILPPTSRPPAPVTCSEFAVDICQADVRFTEYRFDPTDLGFIPPGRWKSGDVKLGDVSEDFFKARSSKILRFEHKLWNALALTTRDPRLYVFIGVKWVTPFVLKVNRNVFGRFLNVTRPAAALYNSQGSFMTHGFIEVSLKDVLTISDEDAFDVDESVVRLFRHGADCFTMRSDREHVMMCRRARALDPHT